MSEAWIEGLPVQRIMFRDGLVISLGDYNEVVIAVPMWLTLPPAGRWPREIVCVDPKAILDEERPLFSISGATCIEARWNDKGDLHMEFSDDHVIDVPHHDFDTAWEIYGKYHGYVASLPRGKVRVVRHDVPEEAGA
jgi:hypothetical protein